MGRLEINSKVHYKKIFYFAMIAFILLFVVSLFVTHGESMNGVLFWDNTDTFMDHFNSVVYSSGDPYENGVIYPPLSTLTYNLLSRIIPEETFNETISDRTALLQPITMKMYQDFLFGFIIFAIIAAIVFFFAVNELKQGRKSEKAIFFFVIFFSSPFLFMIDRGNNIVMPLALSLLYLALYRSDNKVAREIALIALGMAVGFKLYPVAFGVLLVREKKYKEFVRAAIYCIIFTILPFFIFYNGFESISLFLGNISKNSMNNGLDDTAQLSFSKMLLYPLNVLRIRLTDLDAAGTFFNYFTTAACVISAFVVKKRWKAVLLCACVVYGFQDICISYMLTFFVLPLILMLDEEKDNKLINYVYIICFILIFAPIPFKSPGDGIWERYALEKISSYAVGVMTGMVVIESFSDLLTWIEIKFGIEKKHSSIVTIAAVVLLFVVQIVINPCAWFDLGIGISAVSKSAGTIKTILSLILILGAWFGAMVFLHRKGKNLLQKNSENS